VRHHFHVQFSAGTRALAGLGVVLAAGVVLLAVIGHEPATLALAAVLAATTPALIALAWHRLRTLHHHAQRHAESAEEAQRHYFMVLCEVMTVLERRDPRLVGRSERIAQLVAQLAPRLGLPAAQAELLTMIARVHDIGLLSVNPQVLSKPTGLNGPEFNAVKDHCLVGVGILQPLTFLHPVLGAVRSHHERMNGTGYPEGLRGEAIPLEARLLAVADSFDAMTHDRPHRPTLSTRQAVTELIRCAGNGYDEACIKALAAVMRVEDLLAPPAPVESATEVLQTV
jgi:HD-GYP domain-containing protein (c-di-GMP phosphodiesterase class II)